MSEGILGGHKSSTAGTYNVYEVPANTYAEVNISIYSDTTSTAVVRLFVKPTAGTSPTAIHTIQYEKLNVVRNRSERLAIILKAGETVAYYTDSANTHVVVNGIEYPSSGIEFADNELITTNTETVLYEVPATKFAVVNTTVTLDGAGGTDGVVAKLYVSSSDAANGFAIQKDELFATGKTGIERTGVPLVSGQKLILVTTGISGNVSARVHGKIRSAN